MASEFKGLSELNGGNQPQTSSPELSKSDKRRLRKQRLKEIEELYAKELGVSKLSEKDKERARRLLLNELRAQRAKEFEALETRRKEEAKEMGQPYSTKRDRQRFRRLQLKKLEEQRANEEALRRAQNQAQKPAIQNPPKEKEETENGKRGKALRREKARKAKAVKKAAEGIQKPDRRNKTERIEQKPKQTDQYSYEVVERVGGDIALTVLKYKNDTLQEVSSFTCSHNGLYRLEKRDADDNILFKMTAENNNVTLSHPATYKDALLEIKRMQSAEGLSPTYSDALKEVKRTVKSVFKEKTPKKEKPKKFVHNTEAQSVKEHVESVTRLETLKPFAMEPPPALRDAPLDNDDLKIIALSGMREFGKQAYLYGYKGHWILVDCGILYQKFKPENGREVSALLPDIDYVINNILKKKDQTLDGVILTHIHEDHIGGLPPYLKELGYPKVYARNLTRLFLNSKISPDQAKLIDTNKRFDRKHPVNIGPFSIEPIRATHSVPQNSILLIGIDNNKMQVLHTGDWRYDQKSTINEKLDVDRLQSLNGKIDFLVCDSTNAIHEKPPTSICSEYDVARSLKKIIEREKTEKNRVGLATFSTQIERVGAAGKIAREALGVNPVLVGRSMIQNQTIATTAGYHERNSFETLTIKKGTPPVKNPDKLYIMTGSQAENGSALQRISKGQGQVDFGGGDVVIVSASTIPTQSFPIDEMITDLESRGVKVITNGKNGDTTHLSGHANAQDIRQLIDWVKPKYFVPIHGETEHLEANRKIAEDRGIVVPGNFDRNGKVLSYNPYTKRLSVEQLYIPAVIGLQQESGYKTTLFQSEEGLAAFRAQKAAMRGKAFTPQGVKPSAAPTGIQTDILSPDSKEIFKRLKLKMEKNQGRK